MSRNFSLEDIALFNRCIFPADFKLDLRAYGVEWYDASDITSFLIRNPKAGIVGVYQEFINDPKMVAILEQMVYDFIHDKDTWIKKRYENRTE